MAQTYTLEEAAAKLSLSAEDFKRRLRTEWASKVRPMRDGNTLRFRANEIEELGRTLGVGSSEEMQLADSDELDLDSDATIAAPVPLPPAKKPAPKASDEPLNLDSDEVFLMPGDDAGKSPSSKSSKGKSSSDSDIRLRGTKKKSAAPKEEDDESILSHLSEDEFELPTGGSSSKLTGKSGKLSSIKLKSSESGIMPRPETPKAKEPEVPADNDSSEFELSLDADSDDFELSMMPDSSEEVSLGGDPLELKDAAGQSGINLNKPADSGVSLESKNAGKSGKNLGGKSGKMPKPAPQPESDDEIDFELSIDSTGASSSRLKNKAQGDSSSEFELSLEEPSDLSLDLEASGAGSKKGDIFEATDFEIPALEDDSASEAISLDDADTDLESSEFDLAIDDEGVVADDESASEVVSIDEEDVQNNRKKIRKLKADSGVDFDDMEEEGSSASKALAGVNRNEDDEDGEEYEVSESSEEGVRSGYAAPAAWGPLPAIMMIPTMIVLFMGTLMAYELLHGMWGFQQSVKPTTPLINTFAETLGMKSTAQ